MAKITAIDEEKQKISLSIRALLAPAADEEDAPVEEYFRLKKGADRPVCSFFAVPHRCCVLNCFKACGCKGSRRGENRRERAYFVMSERANWRVI